LGSGSSGLEGGSMTIHLYEPVADLKRLFWEWIRQFNPTFQLVDNQGEAKVIVIDDHRHIPLVYRSNAIVVVVGVKPMPERANVLFVDTYEKILDFLEKAVTKFHELIGG
jgi:hypothetical protein